MESLSEVPEGQIEALIGADRHQPLSARDRLHLRPRRHYSYIPIISHLARHDGRLPRAREEGVGVRELYYDAVRPDRAREFDL